jgi:DNA-binding Xre family transcriptional regulator
MMNATELRDVLARHEITSAELAAFAGVTSRAVRYWLEGERPIPGSIWLLCRLLDCRPELLGIVRDIARERLAPCECTA